MTSDILGQLKVAWRTRPAGYKPRTRHLRPNGTPKYTNRLFLSASPYLLQHAHNPTNWYPWGDEAFEAARRLGRPILLSVGYSTCHWCHVMEEESFEDEEIARFINANYIAIKVDREERPDIDAIYMTAVQMLTGGGGWPMTVWLTPDKKPYYGGTYFPARDGDRGAQAGFLTILGRLRSLYDQQPARIAESAARLVDGIAQALSARAPATDLPGASAMRALIDSYRQRFDRANGGTSGAPKFPSNLSVRFLLRFYRRSGDADALHMATLTLERMASGGIYDHVGGGFHRYSTDAGWLVPHFEKMLYDNALLVVAYLEAFQVTGRADFAAVARETLRYLERDMTAPAGALYSATDADSPEPGNLRRHTEGRFFTWTPDEINQVLGPPLGRIATRFYAITAPGNFDGRNILVVPRPFDDVARELGTPSETLRRDVDEINGALYRARALRPPPLRDEKILAAWNGLAISALAKAALALNDGEYAQRAARAADFVLAAMRNEGRLVRAYRGGGKPIRASGAYLEDYAFLIAGLLDLFEATGQPRWLVEAISLDKILDVHYRDQKNGGYFLVSDDHEALLAREKRGQDGAEPSGNSVEALNLLRLYDLTTDERYRQRAEATLKAFSETMRRAPAALAEMMLAVDYQLDDPKEIVVVAPSDRSEAGPFLALLGRTFVPNRVLVTEAGAERDLALARLAPLVEGKVVRAGKPTAYVCRRGVCELPTTDPVVFGRQLQTVKTLELR